MDPIPDLDVLREHLDRLAERGLVVWLSPPGRGRMLTHGLLPPETLAKVRAGLGVTSANQPTPEPDTTPPARPDTASSSAVAPEFEQRLAALETEVAALRARIAALEP